MTPKPKAKELNVLFVDDEVDNLAAFAFNCEEFWNTHTLTSPEDVMARKHPLDPYDAVIIDLVFKYPMDYRPEMKIDPSGGIGLLEWIHKNHPKLPVMVLSAFLTEDIRATIGAKFPNVRCMDKPLDFSRAEFRKLMADYIRAYKGQGKK